MRMARVLIRDKWPRFQSLYILSLVVGLTLFVKMPSRQEKKKAKRRAKYLKTRDDVLHSSRAERNYKAEPEKKRVSQRENYRADPQKNGPLDVQGIEQILKRNGLPGPAHTVRLVRLWPHQLLNPKYGRQFGLV